MSREHSAILIDGIQRGSLRRCPHCGGHFLVAAHGSLLEARAQSEISDISFPRVFCASCDRLTCGRPGCNPTVAGCIPHEARLEHSEGTPNKYGELIDDLLTRRFPI